MKLIAPLLTAACLTYGALPSDAHIDLERTGGVLGQSVTFNLEGDPGQIFLFLPSTTTGPTPLTSIDPTDLRVLNVGLDLLDFLVVGTLDGAGMASFSFPLPAAPVLAGLPIHSQLMTAPGLPTVIDEISKPNAFILGLPGESHLTVGNLPVTIAGYGTALLPDGRVLLGGGGQVSGVGQTSAAKTLRVFDPQTQAFKTLDPDLSYATITPAAVALADGRVLFCGGVNSNNLVLNGASIYNPATGTVMAAANMTTPRAQHTATLLNDGRVFVTGGVKAIDASDPIGSLSDVLKTSSIYNPITNSWSSAANLPKPRVGHNATLLPSGKVLITGGLELDFLFTFPIPAISSSCRRYNPANNSMQSTASMSGGRALHGQLTLSDGRVMVAGGADGDVLTQNFSSVSTCRVYNEGSNSWTNIASMPTARTLPSLVEAGGRVHVVSGLSTIDLATLSGNPVTAIISTSTASFAWQPAGQMTTGRPASSAMAIEGGERILILGPATSGGSSTTDKTAEIYIP